MAHLRVYGVICHSADLGEQIRQKKKFFCVIGFRDWQKGFSLPTTLNWVWSFIVGDEIDLRALEPRKEDP